MRFIGRKEYLEDLESLWRKKSSSIVACRGRRRIGKSTLFREFARRTADAYVEIEGLPPDKNMTNRMQVDNFMSLLASQTGCRMDGVPDWLHAFQRLEQQIDDAKRTVVLLDEISWMGGYDPTFPGVLRTAWETFLHRHERLVFVVCGSVSAWIKENILDNTGFTGRFSRDYVLPELSLSECAEFWGEARERVASREILDVLSVTGGVPRYLEEIDPGLNADENIRRMGFMSAGELYKDFDAIFNPMFGSDVELKKKILLALVDGPLSAAELERAFDLGRNGRVSRSLKALKEGGFVTDDPRINPETGEQSRTARFRLRDNYTRFYLKYIAPRKMQIDMGAYRFVSLAALPDWNTVMGRQFENLIVNNAMSLLPYLHAGNVIVESAAPYRNLRRGGKADGGCQIDLLIQTPRTVYVVEVKRRRDIGTEVIDEVERKIKRLPLRRGLTARPVLVYDGELHPAVEASGFFDVVVPVQKLLCG